MTKRQKKQGRPRGIPRPGSGNHPLDLEWRARGYVTVKEAAENLGCGVRGVYRRIQSGAFVPGRDYAKPMTAWGGAGPVYLRLASVVVHRDQFMPPKDEA